MYYCNLCLMTLALFLGAKMLNAFNVRWLEKDETKIKYTDDFEKQHWVLKADILQDAMYELEKKYQQIIELGE